MLHEDSLGLVSILALTLDYKIISVIWRVESVFLQFINWFDSFSRTFVQAHLRAMLSLSLFP